MQQTIKTDTSLNDRKKILAHTLTTYQVEQIKVGFDDRYQRNLVRSFQFTAGIQFRLNTIKVVYQGRKVTLQRFLKDFVYEVAAHCIDGFGGVPGTFGNMVFMSSGTVKVEAYLRALPEFEEYTV
jgi:hypothetical protein